ncbi:MAG: DNA repair exonuclease [Mesorhizobium sp.]|uniref:metallophosphoesterase family protein n=1 Tax=Mesorhizobium sp. TaxID=1871066 RepID=UPI00120C8981|nr:DNA repair exonuclease [Mesorhizobium sp.]TIP73336.1 MAG: DNA repair exonuclease [Mesorhizobium sp.]TIQ11406.1 MAG: DNA repair exonuclease [Mesorhizobium sp.]TIR50911.1 MAG: DNA repair exonuclease [Mesorhizobium sp.]TJV93351.1 MAG: DNA repair exonuclease [Mesorhizobium sp.]
MFRFIHSSDLHLGRRFGNFPEDARGRLVEARHAAIGRLAASAQDHGASHVLLAGDVFDTETPSDAVWRHALAAMSFAQGIQWWILPGNHDSLAAEALWGRVRTHAPTNVHLLGAPEPVEIAPRVVLLPAPVPRRFPGRDLTEWMPLCATPEDHFRIGLAHGGVLSFGSEDGGAEIIPPDRAKSARLDYLALGDWHGLKQFGDRTFYSGTPERDRFKHGGPGSCLAVTLMGPGKVPQVNAIQTGQFDWREAPLALTPAQDAVAALEMLLPAEGRARRDMLLRIRATGWLRLPARMALARAAELATPEFWHFEFDDADLATECSLEDLDGIALSGALRLAAEGLHQRSEDAATNPTDRAIAAAALRRLYNYVQGEAQ